MIAENVHDEWAVNKISNGFTHGEVTDNEAKTHIDLIPYSELSEEAKEYDRKTAMSTIRLILHMGYAIVPAEPTQV